MNTYNLLKKISPIALVLGLILGSTTAQAQSNQSTLNVSMDVDLQCSIKSVSDVNLGAYTGAAAIVGTGTVTWQCTKTATATSTTIKMDCGLNGSVSNGVCASRLKNQSANFASSFLNYKLCTTNGATCPTEIPYEGRNYSYTGQGTVMSNNFYVNLPAGQYTAQYGDYLDTITTSIVF